MYLYLLNLYYQKYQMYLYYIDPKLLEISNVFVVI